MRFRLLASCVFLGGAIWLAIYYNNGVEKYAQLAKSGVPVEGHVVELDCSNHGTFTYIFSVSGNRYGSKGHASALGLVCTSLRVNQPVGLVYLTNDPSVNFAGKPAEKVEEQYVLASVAALFYPGAILLALKIRRRRNA